MKLELLKYTEHKIDCRKLQLRGTEQNQINLKLLTNILKTPS